MIGFILKKIIGSKNDREVKRLRARVDEINRFEAALQNQSSDVLRQKTAAWKEELSKITDNEELARRLIGRGTEDAATQEARLAAARAELAAETEFDHTVVNTDVRSAAAGLVQLMAESRPGSPVR